MIYIRIAFLVLCIVSLSFYLFGSCVLRVLRCSALCSALFFLCVYISYIKFDIGQVHQLNIIFLRVLRVLRVLRFTAGQDKNFSMLGAFWHWIFIYCYFSSLGSFWALIFPEIVLYYIPSQVQHPLVLARVRVVIVLLFNRVNIIIFIYFKHWRQLSRIHKQGFLKLFNEIGFLRGHQKNQ